jgi:hypothetical protein
VLVGNIADERTTLAANPPQIRGNTRQVLYVKHSAAASTNGHEDGGGGSKRKEADQISAAVRQSTGPITPNTRSKRLLLISFWAFIPVWKDLRSRHPDPVKSVVKYICGLSKSAILCKKENLIRNFQAIYQVRLLCSVN